MIYLGLGSNLGDRASNLAEARRQLRRHGLTIVHEGQVIETEPYGVLDQPPFLNQVIEVGGAAIEPVHLLHVCKSVEAEIGRRPARRWGPRLIDLDILLIGDLVLSSPSLAVPHPDLLNREFVMAPLVALAPGLVHPGTGRRLAEHLAELRLRGGRW